MQSKQSELSSQPIMASLIYEYVMEQIRRCLREEWSRFGLRITFLDLLPGFHEDPEHCPQKCDGRCHVQ